MAEMEKQDGGANGFSGEKRPDSALISHDDKAEEVDLFYEKLRKLNESSGLSLVFNYRDTMLDLHRFYKEVIKRGGFYQVTKMGKWDDIASVSNSKSCVSIPATQLQNVYKTLILQYELMHFRKMPDEANICLPGDSSGYFGPWASPSCSKGKPKHWDSSYPFQPVHLGDQDGRTDKGPETANKNSTMIMSPNSKVKAKKPRAPRKPRTGYHIFLRLESRRLKTILGERSGSQNVRELAVAAWRCLTDKEKLPYIEAGKMDMERYDREMTAYSQTVSTAATPSPTVLNFSPSDDVYRVSLQDDSETIHPPDQSMVELAVEVMKNAESHESIFQID